MPVVIITSRIEIARKRGNTNHKMNKKGTPQTPPLLLDGGVATRAHRQQQVKLASAKLTEQRPILVHILSYADSDTLREVCLVSTYFLDIVRNNNGNEINLLPLLELSCSSELGAILEELLH